MPEFGYAANSINDLSQLTNGFHPAYLMAIHREDIPEGWVSYKPELSPTENFHYRWCFLVWERADDVTSVLPERQSAISSKIFAPKGKKNPASKAYTWTCALLDREIVPGERINLDPLMPIPCVVLVERNEQYANIKGLHHHKQMFPQGMTLLTPEYKAALQEALETERPQPTQPPVVVTQSPPNPAPSYQGPTPTQQPMTTWANKPPQPTADPTKKGW